MNLRSPWLLLLLVLLLTAVVQLVLAVVEFSGSGVSGRAGAGAHAFRDSRNNVSG